MIYATAAELSQILHDADPMGTSCNVNAGMEDEYDSIAVTILEYAEDMSDAEAVERAIIYWFDEYLLERSRAKLFKCIPSSEF
jgi:hypothetical protein